MQDTVDVNITHSTVLHWRQMICSVGRNISVWLQIASHKVELPLVLLLTSLSVSTYYRLKKNGLGLF